MTTIVQTSPSGTTLNKVLIETTLNGTADIIPFVRGSGQILILRNPTGSTISAVKIFGSAAGISGIPGGVPVDYSLGYLVGNIATLQSKFVRLEDIFLYLAGTVTVSVGAGLVAILVAND